MSAIAGPCIEGLTDSFEQIRPVRCKAAVFGRIRSLDGRIHLSRVRKKLPGSTKFVTVTFGATRAISAMRASGPRELTKTQKKGATT